MPPVMVLLDIVCEREQSVGLYKVAKSKRLSKDTSSGLREKKYQIQLKISQMTGYYQLYLTKNRTLET